MKQIIGGVLIILSIVIGYDGIQKFQGSSASVKVLGIELSAEDKGAKETAFVELVFAALVLAGGIYLMRSSKS
jgi:hypothetical protein